MKTAIHYLLMNPTGNQTILVETQIPEELQPNTAAELMLLEPTAEQVGFLSQAQGCDVFLRMAGGEFCGNAAMSAAVYYAMRKGLSEGNVSVRISGTDKLVEVFVSAGQSDLWDGIVEMPQPNSIHTVSFSNGIIAPIVVFPGITHVILEENLPRSDAERIAVQWCKELDASALGMMFLNRAEHRLTPLVYVPAVNTLFWESACASGTTAVGAWLANTRNREITEKLRQPGGDLEICAVPNGSLRLKGHVSCLYEKTIIPTGENKES